MNKRSVLAGLAGLVAFSAVAASAASLGGLGGQSLGANDTVVASCDSDGVTIAYTTAYNPSTGKYATSGATVSGIATGCDGKTLSVTVSGAAGAALGSGTATVVAGGTQAVTFATPAAAESVVGAAVVISG